MLRNRYLWTIALILLSPGCISTVETEPAAVSVRGWTAACDQAWSTGAYRFAAPPVVGNRTCKHLTIGDVTLKWAVYPEKVNNWSYPLVAGDGYDWLFFSAVDGHLKLLTNDSKLQDLGAPMDFEPRNGPRAVRTENGEIHVVYLSPTRQSSLTTQVHHWWVTPGQPAESEVLLGTLANWGSTHFLRTDGQRVITATNDLNSGLFHWTTGGPFVTEILPGLPIWGVAVAPGEAYACAGTPASYVLLHRTWREGIQGWVPDPIPEAAPGAHVAGRCQVTISDAGPVAAYPLAGGTRVWTRAATGWQSAIADVALWSSLQMSSGGNVPVLFGDGGAGSVDGDGDNAWFFVPSPDNLTDPWLRAQTAWASAPHLIDHPWTVAVAASNWGSPFRYPFTGPDGKDEVEAGLRKLGWVVVEWDAP